MRVEPGLQRIRNLCKEGRFQQAFDESHRAGLHFEGAMLQLQHDRSHYAMELLKKSEDPAVWERGAREMLRRKLPDPAAELLEKAAGLAEKEGAEAKARELYFKAGHAAVAYKRPDYAVEMFDKANKQQEGARILSFKGWKAWGAMLLHQGDFHEEADIMERKARKSDITARDNWIEAKRLEQEVEEAKKSEASESDIAAKEKLIAKHYKTAASASTRLKIHPLHPFATMFYAMGDDLEKSVERAMRAGRPDWLVPISELFGAPKPKIRKWADRVARQGQNKVAAELYEMADEPAKGGDSAMQAKEFLWAARLYKKAKRQRAYIEAMKKAKFGA